MRPEYISNIENEVKLRLKPTIIETTGFDKNVTFDFAGGEIIGRFTPNSGAELSRPHEVYFYLSKIFDNT